MKKMMQGGLLALWMAGCTGSDGAQNTRVFGYDSRPENLACVAPAERLVEEARVGLERVFGSVSLESPIAALQAPGDPSHWYVIEQSGRVKRFDARLMEPVAEVVLDLSDQVQNDGEMGLLGFAFHPNFASNGRAVLSFVDNASRSVIATVQTQESGAVWDASSVTEILSVQQPYENHNGGDVAFGPDGALFWALGDGGGAGDPDNRAQDQSSLFGKLLRIGIDGASPYEIPADNPFVGMGGREEIYALGLRNPFRFSFDPGSGELWLGDVGQNAFEEIDRIEAGGNYGWPIKEGASCYPEPPCEEGGLIEPVYSYAQDPGFSVIGGVVYRGTGIPELVGTYLFSDFFHGRIMGLRYDQEGIAYGEQLADSGRYLVHFTTGADGEVYVLDRGEGALFKLVPEAPPPASGFPMTLSATGCVANDDPTAPASGVIPYQLNHSFWADGAGKQRWLAIPEGTQIQVKADGDLDFPVGSVLLKEFSVDGERIETRLFMRHDETTWGGYAYKWREDGSDADLLRGKERVTVMGREWEIPSPPNCMQCHSDAAGRSLGLELGQLVGAIDYPSTGRRASQLATLQHVGMIALPDARVEAWPDVGDVEASVEDRARTYLHVNCSPCHRPDGPGQSDLDLRRTTPFAEMGVCRPPTDGALGLQDAQVITPGSPSTSVLLARMNASAAYRMPPMGTLLVDAEGSALIEEWINALSPCP